MREFLVDPRKLRGLLQLPEYPAWLPSGLAMAAAGREADQAAVGVEAAAGTGTAARPAPERIYGDVFQVRPYVAPSIDPFIGPYIALYVAPYLTPYLTPYGDVFQRVDHPFVLGEKFGPDVMDFQVRPCPTPYVAPYIAPYIAPFITAPTLSSRCRCRCIFLGEPASRFAPPGYPSVVCYPGPSTPSS